MSDSRVSAPQTCARLRTGRRDESGAALVEFALVVVIFMLVLYGLISFGMIMATKQRVTNAASEAARSAVGEANDVDAIATATARVDALLGAEGAYGTRVVTTVPCGTSTCVKVRIQWNYKVNPVVPPAPGIGLVTPEFITSEAQVQYK